MIFQTAESEISSKSFLLAFIQELEFLCVSAVKTLFGFHKISDNTLRFFQTQTFAEKNKVPLTTGPWLGTNH
jgi:hypothetical protein